MRLYRKPDGLVVGTLKEAGREHEVLDVPVDKAGLIAWLNEHLPPPAQLRDRMAEDFAGVRDMDLSDPLRQPNPIVADYQSPMTARTVIAGIDAGMCASAIKQMDGRNLSKVVSASIERMAELSSALPATPAAEDLLA